MSLVNTTLDGKRQMDMENSQTKLTESEQLQWRAKRQRWQVLNGLDTYLIQFETNFKARGGQVEWAETIEQVHQMIATILEENQVQAVTVSDSFNTNEVHIRNYLSEWGHQSEDNPELYKLREDIADTAVIPQLTEVGISGADFLLAKEGLIALLRDDTRALQTSLSPKVHIVLAGIDRVIPDWESCFEYATLFSENTLNKSNCSNALFLAGPSGSVQQEGPQKLVVILLDNNRSRLLSDLSKKELLHCVNCRACTKANALSNIMHPDFKQNRYDSPYEFLLAYHLNDDNTHTTVPSYPVGDLINYECPVNINLKTFYDEIKQEKMEERKLSLKEKYAWKTWSNYMLSRNKMNANNLTKKLLLKTLLPNGDILPNLAKKTFNELWKASGRGDSEEGFSEK